MNTHQQITNNIAIIGAGSSGLFLAKMLSQNKQIDVAVFEKSDKIASKLKASGGGKANIMNSNILPSHYNNNTFIEQLLERVNYPTIRSEFEKMGLLMVADDEGRVYPVTRFSQTVVDVLTNDLPENVHLLCNNEVKSLKTVGNKWCINQEKKLFDKVILAGGSPAGMIEKKRTGYYNYLQQLNLKQQPLSPSLTGFKIKNYPKSLSGCRTKAIVSLYQDDRLITKEKGEVIFKDDGISGIVILNCSAYYNRLVSKNNCYLTLNFMYNDETYDIEKYLNKFHNLSGVVHPKINEYYKRQPFNIKKFTLYIDTLYSYDQAQVCHGGIDISEIDFTFHIKKYQNLFATGEILDIDGVCGGYNLFFAFASAYITAKAIENEIKNQ